VVAILFGEASAAALLASLAADPDRIMSVASYTDVEIALGLD